MTMTAPEIPTAEPDTAKEVVELREELTALREELTALTEVMYAMGAVAQVALRPTPFAQGAIQLFSAVLEDGPPDEEHLGATATRVDDPEPAEPGLAARVEALEARFDDLVESLAGEVRTRRLVVVDEHGKECITTFISDAETALDVTHPRATDLTAGLFVSCSSAEQDFVGVVAHADGENLVLLEGAVDKERAADGEAAGRLLLRGDLARRGEHVRYGLDGISVRP